MGVGSIYEVHTHIVGKIKAGDHGSLPELEAIPSNMVELITNVVPSVHYEIYFVGRVELLVDDLLLLELARLQALKNHQHEINKVLIIICDIRKLPEAVPSWKLLFVDLRTEIIAVELDIGFAHPLRDRGPSRNVGHLIYVVDVKSSLRVVSSELEQPLELCQEHRIAEVPQDH